jgi:hypothetical protein
MDNNLLSMLHDDSIASKLINESFKISAYTDYSSYSTTKRSDFINQSESDMPYFDIADKFDININTLTNNADTYTTKDKYTNQTFIYDMLVISKLYAIIYRLYWYEFNIKYKSDITKWKLFCENTKLEFIEEDASASIKTKIDGYTVKINKLFDISNLNLHTNQDVATYDYDNIYKTGTNHPGMDPLLLTKYYQNNILNIIGSEYKKYIKLPFYHSITDYLSIPYLALFTTNTSIKEKYYKFNFTTRSRGSADDIIYTSSATNYLPIFDSGVTNLNKANLNASYTTLMQTNPKPTNYLFQRKFIYLEALNVILNTDSTIILSTLKYYMHYYNLVVYNAIIQYGLVKTQNARVSTLSKFRINDDYCTYTNIKTGITTKFNAVKAVPLIIAAQVDTSILSGVKFRMNFTNNTLNIITIFINNSSDVNNFTTDYGGWKPMYGKFLTQPTEIKKEPDINERVEPPIFNINLDLFNINPLNKDAYEFISLGNGYGANTYTFSLTFEPHPQINENTEYLLLIDTNKNNQYEIINKIVAPNGTPNNKSPATNYVVPPIITFSEPGSGAVNYGRTIAVKPNKLGNFNAVGGKINIDNYNITNDFQGLNIDITNGYTINKKCPPKTDESVDVRTIENSYYAYSGLTAATVDFAELKNTISKITNNVIEISDKLLAIPKKFTNIRSNIIKTSTDNENTSQIFYKNQFDLNKTINEYNTKLEIFNSILYYCRIIIAFYIILFILILFIFGINSIDKNFKISIYVIIIILMIIIIAVIIYNQQSNIKEDFTIIIKNSSSLTTGDDSPYTNSITNTAINNYKLEMEKYITNLTLSLTNNNINNIASSLEYIKKLSIVKNEKAKIYKIKKINLINAIEILKKNSNFYYYIIIFIAFCIIILTIGLILVLIIPVMILQILIICFISFIILVYYISYNIQKSTQLEENKKYWSNFNPSSTTLSDL